MHEEVLPRGTVDVLRALEDTGILASAYLAGGTNIALQIGHRISRDLDFFTPNAFDEHSASRLLEKVGMTTEQMEKQTIGGFFGDVKFSYFHYSYPLLFPVLSYASIALADLHDAAVMKVDTIASRGLRRDFIDLFAVMQSQGLQLPFVMSLYGKKYEKTHNTALHALKRLAYFADADTDDTPLTMLQPMEWNVVKDFFRSEVESCATEMFAK